MGIFVAVMQVLNSDRSCDLFEYAHELNSAAPAFGSTLHPPQVFCKDVRPIHAANLVATESEHLR